MFIFVKNNHGTIKVILDDSGKETALKSFETENDPKTRRPTPVSETQVLNQAIAHAKTIAMAMGCECVPHELTVEECQLAVKNDRVTKHHVDYLLRINSKWSGHICPGCHHCGDRS